MFGGLFVHTHGVDDVMSNLHTHQGPSVQQLEPSEASELLEMEQIQNRDLFSDVDSGSSTSSDSDSVSSEPEEHSPTAD